MHFKFIFLIFLFLCNGLSAESYKNVTIRIAFGSCARQTKPQPIWESVLKTEPDLFLFLGDTIYGDTEDMQIMKQKYDTLAANPGYKKLRETKKILAVWDDHEYGKNDAGAEYPKKKESKELFLDFFKEPLRSQRRQREGNYDSYMLEKNGIKIQFLLLDERYFRSSLIKNNIKKFFGTLYDPNLDPEATMLGQEQWKWLSDELDKKADIRIFASGTQLIPNEHGFEKWDNFPLERKKFFDLLETKKISGGLILSGDRHFAEISRMDNFNYPLYEITSSSLNQKSHWNIFPDTNKFRIGTLYKKPNFGLLEIVSKGNKVELNIKIISEIGTVVNEHKIYLHDLTFRK